MKQIKKQSIKLLAIDTSTQHFSVCYYNNGQFLEKNILGDAKSSSYILQMIQQVISLDDLSKLNGIIYTTGPGAFTGVRVGIGVVCGLSLAKQIPTLGFSSLEVMEFGAKIKFNKKNIISAIDARMGEVYLRFNSKNLLINPVDFQQKLLKYTGVGTGFKAYGNFAKCEKIVEDFHPKAKNLIKLALNNIDKLNFYLPTPLYLRNNIAKKYIKP